MKIYLAHSIQLPQSVSASFLEHFKKHKHSLFTRKLPLKLPATDYKEAEEIYEANMKMIRSADIVIAEISYVSIDIRHDILLALQDKKPVIALSNMKEDLENPRHTRNIPIGLRGNKNKYLILREYNSKNISEVINKSINDASKLFDRKFNFILPAEIDDYLEWNVKHRKIPKSEIARTAIEEMMESIFLQISSILNNRISLIVVLYLLGIRTSIASDYNLKK
jgi:nucleoside 2-deoxyribosyltransferase